MKRKILTLLLLISLGFVSMAQTETKLKIDNLKTEKEVENFVKSFDRKRYERFTISKIQDIKNRYGEKNNFCKKIADSLNITKSFYKADFDQNGLTDILVIGKYYDFNIFVAMDFGKDSLKLYTLTRRSFQNCVVPEISKIGDKTVINYYDDSEPNEIIKKVLVYKFGDFIEYNNNPKEYNIEKIEYQTTMCYGTCPKFSITIDKNKNGTFDAQNYNRKERKRKEIKGEFTTTIKEEDYNSVIELLNYIDFPNLKDNYAVGWTDDQSCTLKITYDNGKIKEIKDYGLIGTFGLNRLYNLMFDLRFSQEWKRNKAGNKKYSAFGK